MNWLMGLALKWSGFGWVWGKIDGWKTAIAGASGLLHALAALALFLAGLLDRAQPVLAAHDLGALAEFGRSLSGFGSDPSVVAFSKAWQDFYTGLGFVGLGHKLDKAVAEDPPAK